jgi:hypothetical protein
MADPALALLVVATANLLHPRMAFPPRQQVAAVGIVLRLLARRVTDPALVAALPLKLLMAVVVAMAVAVVVAATGWLRLEVVAVRDRHQRSLLLLS